MRPENTRVKDNGMLPTVKSIMSTEYSDWENYEFIEAMLENFLKRFSLFNF